MDDIDKNFDVIVYGTGFIESLVAAACARVGIKTLHLDSNEYYGGPWASFTLKALDDWTTSLIEEKECFDETADSSCPDDGVKLPSDSTFFNVKRTWHNRRKLETRASTSNANLNGSESNDDIGAIASSLNGVETADDTERNEDSNVSQHRELEAQGCDNSGDAASAEETVWSKEELMKDSRRFNIDLTPRLVYCKGKLVELLISSNVARYLEFKCLNRILAWLPGEDVKNPVPVPCSRSDVFQTESVPLIDKRFLMKFMEFCSNYEEKREEWGAFESKPFTEFLTSMHLSSTIQHFVLSCISMVPRDVKTEEGLKKTAVFIKSIGHFGPMPFLYPLYGSGEVPQAFCRLCAVFEGIYMLRKPIDCLKLRENRVCEVSSEGSVYSCENLVMSGSYVPAHWRFRNGERYVSRAVLITDRSISPFHGDNVTLLRMPKGNDQSDMITILELGHGTAVCPKNLYLVHLTCEGFDAENDFSHAINSLFNVEGEENLASSSCSGRPGIIFALYFNQKLSSSTNGDCPTNLYACGTPESCLDYDWAIEQARQIFSSMYPDKEFLPRAPDPQEIIFQEDEPTANGERVESERSTQNLEE